MAPADQHRYARDQSSFVALNNRLDTTLLHERQIGEAQLGFGPDAPRPHASGGLSYIFVEA